VQKFTDKIGLEHGAAKNGSLKKQINIKKASVKQAADSGTAPATEKGVQAKV